MSIFPVSSCCYFVKLLNKALKQSCRLPSSMVLLLNLCSLVLSFKRRDSICQNVLLQAKPQAFLTWVGERCHMFDISWSQNPSPFAYMWAVLDIEQLPYFALSMCRVYNGICSNLNKGSSHVQCKRKNCLVQMSLEFRNSF